VFSPSGRRSTCRPHSGATEVRLIIEVSEGKLIILVADNGHGFDLATKSSGGEGIQACAIAWNTWAETVTSGADRRWN